VKLILASASERREELLKRITEDFCIMVSDFNEDEVLFRGGCAEYVKEIAKGKAQATALKARAEFSCFNEDVIIIGCDTIVSCNGKVLGKPKDQGEAFEMLRLLSGKTHEVYSGIALIQPKLDIIKNEAVCTKVKFSALSDEEIIQYIKTKEPMDKAGAYGIQGYGGTFVEEIHGCYYNVMGLPLNKLNFMLKEMGVNL
jgi:septum formation protein